MRLRDWIDWGAAGTAMGLLAATVYSMAWINAGNLALLAAFEASSPEEASLLAARAQMRLARFAGETIVAHSLGHAYYLQGEHGEALAHWQGVDGVAYEMLARGEMARWAESNKMAVQWDELAVTLAPNSGDAHYHLAQAYADMGRVADALNALERARTLGTEMVGASDVDYEVGRILVYFGDDADLEAALARFERAISSDAFGVVRPGLAHLHRAHTLRRLGRSEAAIAAYEAALSAIPNNYAARVHLGALCGLEQGDMVSAEALLTGAAAAQPENPTAYRYLGDIYAAQGRVEEARRMYETVLEIVPHDRLAVQRLGKLGGP